MMAANGDKIAKRTVERSLITQQIKTQRVSSLGCRSKNCLGKKAKNKVL